MLLGKPNLGLIPWGSFESWSGAVRNTVVWCDLPEPGETRFVIQAEADEAGRGLRLLIQGLKASDPRGKGLTAAEILDQA